MTKGLLVNLHKLASGQDENFITECFVNFLSELIRLEPTEGIELLRQITNNNVCLTYGDLKNLNIQTQISTDEGVPDIAIQVNDCLVYIEVKVESSFGPDQIMRYKRQLNQYSDYKNTQLIVLTKNHFIPSGDGAIPDFKIRWIQVAELIENLNLKTEIGKYITKQFLELLKFRRLSMDAVSWEFINGFKSFNNLIEMIGEMLISNGIKPDKSLAWNWAGHYIDNRKFFMGIYFNDPQVVVFDTESAFTLEVTDKFEFGEIRNGRWFHGLDMTSEEHYFFSRTKVSQMKCLEKHFRKSYDYAKTLGR